jgi:uncharacterized protein (TIGR02646 family)
MRHIDIDLLEPEIPAEWKKKALQAYHEVKNALPGKERSDKMDDYSYLWRELKQQLKKLSQDKCWYCESAGHRIIGDVDHFRPKNKLKKYGDQPNLFHLGYWWLVFDWKNYRYSCELCNRRNRDHLSGEVGGKGSFFPLLDETKRIFDECKPYEILQEMPLLLDPTVPTDPLLLTFNTDGSALPASKDKDERRRAEASIRLYHLNQVDLRERRKHEICRVIYEKVLDADLFYWQYDQDNSNIAAKQGLYKVIKELKRMIHERAEYSSTAREILKLYERGRQWIYDLLTAS